MGSILKCAGDDHLPPEEEEAIEALRTGLAIDPRNTYGWNDLGIILDRHLQYDDAIEAFQEALKLDPDLDEARLNMGLAYFDKANFSKAEGREFHDSIEGAIKSFSTIVDEDPTNEEGLKWLIESLKMLDNVWREVIDKHTLISVLRIAIKILTEIITSAPDAKAIVSIRDDYVRKSIAYLSSSYKSIKIAKIAEIVGCADDTIETILQGMISQKELDAVIDDETIQFQSAMKHDDDDLPGFKQMVIDLLEKGDRDHRDIIAKIEINQILTKMMAFVENRPKELPAYITRIMKSNWSVEKKDIWASVAKDMFEEFRQTDRNKWQKLGKILLSALGKLIGEKVAEFAGEMATQGIKMLFEWVKEKLSAP
jgi:tetratricopeptide (TPR) repeat protein